MNAIYRDVLSRRSAYETARGHIDSNASPTFYVSLVESDAALAEALLNGHVVWSADSDMLVVLAACAAGGGGAASGATLLTSVGAHGANVTVVAVRASGTMSDAPTALLLGYK